ncbi:MAG: gliding motility-associated C-terminal domain-containing protein, partial [Bacteroidota bacterium]
SLCTQDIVLDITEPDSLVLSTQHTDVSCFGFADGTGEVSILGGTNPFQISWNTDPVQDQNLAEGLAGGSYRVAVLDANGCTALDSVEIFEPDTLIVELIESSVVKAFCDWPNGQAAVQTDGGRLPHQIQWLGPSVINGLASDTLRGGSYAVSVSDLSGCVSTITVIIPETPPAAPNFITVPSFGDSILLSQADVFFSNQTIGGVAYQWNFGDGGLSEEENPRHRYGDTGRFPVTLTAFNSYFVCPVDTTIYLHIIPDGAIFLPNAFSPNNDGVNDLYFAGGEGLISYEMQIFDRWGRIVTTLTNLSSGWDGRNRQGNPVSEGVYVYHVRARMNDGSVVDRGGTITLFR